MAPLIAVVLIIFIFIIWPNWIDYTAKSLQKSLAERNLEKLTKQLKWAVPLSLWNGKILMMRAYTRMIKGDIDRGFADLNRVVAKNRGNVRHLCYRGEVYRSVGKYTEATQDFEDARLYQPKYSDALIGLIQVKLKLGYLAEASERAEELVAAHPSLATSYYWRGHVKAQIGDQDEAIKDFDRATLMNSQYVEAISSRGVIHIFIGAYERARKDLDTALEIDPERVFVACNRVVITLKEGNFDQALGEANAIIEKFPKNSYPYVCRALVNLCRKDYQAVTDDLEIAFEHDPKSGYGMLRRGDLYFVQQKYNEAAEQYKSAISLDPHNEDAIASLALAKYQLEDKVEAQRLWKQVLEYDRRYGSLGWVTEYYNLFDLKAQTAIQLVQSLF